MQVEEIIKKHLPEDEEFIWRHVDLTGIIRDRFRDCPYALIIGLKMEDGPSCGICVNICPEEKVSKDRTP